GLTHQLLIDPWSLKSKGSRTDSLFSPVSRSCSNVYSLRTRLDPNRAPAAIVRSVARVITNRVLRAELISNLFVDTGQVFKSFYGKNATASSLRQQPQLTPRDFIKPCVNRANHIGYKSLPRHCSLRRMGIVLGKITFDLTLREIHIIGIGLGLQKPLERCRFSIQLKKIQ